MRNSDRLAEAERLVADATRIDEDGFPVRYHYDVARFDRRRAFQLFYWLIARARLFDEVQQRCDPANDVQTIADLREQLGAAVAHVKELEQQL